MSEKMCYHCNTSFEFDDKDIRPYIYHKCEDGTTAGMKNPNFWEKKPVRKTFPSASRNIKSSSRTIWQEFK